MTKDHEENPYQSPQAASEVAQPPDKSPEELRQIAIYHKGLMVCFLVQVLVTLVQMMPPPYILLQDFIPSAVFALAGNVVLVLMIVEIIWVFLACVKLYSMWEAFLLMLAPCIPLVGLFAVMSILSRARRVLKQHGCRMGWFGADLAQFR